jgi:hypothetical protein
MGALTRVAAPRKLTLAALVLFVLAGCAGGGVTGPCNDSDPVGPCATSHGQTHGG